MSVTERRIGLLFAAFLALLALGGLRAGWLGTVKAGALRQAANVQQVQQLPVPARRGDITDRHGVDLAVSEPAADVAVTPYLVKHPQRAAAKLYGPLNQTYDEVLAKLTRRHTGFVYLARQLPADRALKVQRADVPGIQIVPTNRRTYPRAWTAAQVIGSVGVDGHGLSGLEYADDGVLAGHAGLRELTRDAIGQPIAVKDVQVARPGSSLRLTLDATLQAHVETVLGEVGAKYRPKDATAIVMDPRSGQVLAMANWPRVDANHLNEAPAYARQNRAVGFTYEPGSTFKPFTFAGALQDGTITPDTPFDVPPQIQVADRTIHNAENLGDQHLTASQILAQSNNVGTIMIGQRMGARRFSQWVDAFGFGRPTGIDLPGEERGAVLPLARYSGSSMGNLPIGQGLLVTPLQMATEYAAIANGGVLRAPRVIGAIDGTRTPTPPGRRIMSRKVAAELRQMLRGVLAQGGTAGEVSIPGYQLAGKTGTASKVDPRTGLYSQSRYVASFVGFAPAGDPKLLCAVMVDEPQGAIYGGVVAAPAFGQIMGFALPYLGIPPG